MTTTRSTTSSGRTTLTPTPKLPDFTEDPFRNYRYEDPFAISDPFADDEDNNGNKNNNNNNNNKLDPFGFETTTTSIQNNDSFSTRGFESDFTNSYTTKNKNNFLNDTFKNSNNLEFVQQLSTTTTTTKPVNKPINFEEAFSSSNKIDKTNKTTDHSIAQVFKDKLGIKHGLHNKNKNNYNNNNHNNNNNNNTNNNGNGAWTGKNLSVSMNEQQQLAWAAQQSLKAEEERRRIKAQEDADLALALERSKHE